MAELNPSQRVREPREAVHRGPPQGTEQRGAQSTDGQTDGAAGRRHKGSPQHSHAWASPRDPSISKLPTLYWHS